MESGNDELLVLDLNGKIVALHDLTNLCIRTDSGLLCKISVQFNTDGIAETWDEDVSIDDFSEYAAIFLDVLMPKDQALQFCRALLASPIESKANNKR